jgi:tetratricopeptide (TPR) repeat protein
MPRVLGTSGDPRWPCLTRTSSPVKIAVPPTPSTRRFAQLAGRLTPVLGCLTAFVCVLVIYVSIGLAGAFEGLRERQALREQNADEHYQLGLNYMQDGRLELAIAEFDLTLTLDARHRLAREALREAKSLALAQPTPTSAARRNVAEELFAEVDALTQQGNWRQAAELLEQVRDVDPAYKPAEVTELLYLANYELGLRFVAEGQLPEALSAFERALAARPGDTAVIVEQGRVQLYLTAEESWGEDWEETIALFEHLYREAPDFLNVRDRLFEAYQAFADDLVRQQEWCLAAPRYASALDLNPGPSIEGKLNDTSLRCQAALTQIASPSPTKVVVTATPGFSQSPVPITLTKTVTATAVTSGTGKIVFSRFNTQVVAWEIVSVPVQGGPALTLARDATQPAVSPNGQLLTYHSELADSEGLHVLDLASGEDARSTIYREDVLPQWGADNMQMVFASRRAGDRRWQIFLGFADGKGEPVTLFAGRTPAWSADGAWLAYQGTDTEGNNPGIYLRPVTGGPEQRLTSHASDRAPRFSPQGDRLAYMSAQSGNWAIYVVDLEGAPPRQLTDLASSEGLPVWSGDGSHIAFVSDLEGGWAVYVVEAAGGRPRRVADWGDEHPDWLLEQIAWMP